MPLPVMASGSNTLFRVGQRCGYCTDFLRQRLNSAQHSILTDVQQRHVHRSTVHYKIVPKNLQGRSKTAQDWLTRQLNDPYVFKARKFNYRARSAFKLLELQQSYKFLRPGAVVAECGCSPGAWTQVAVQHCNPRDSAKFDPKAPAGVVVGVDLHAVSNMAGATFIHGDFTFPDTQKKLLEALAPHKPDVVLSDMAPSATGVKDMDHERIMRLAYAVAHFAKAHAAPDSTLVCKVWSGQRLSKFVAQLAQLYREVKTAKPPASRTNSAEVFVVACGLKQGAQADVHEENGSTASAKENNVEDSVQ